MLRPHKRLDHFTQQRTRTPRRHPLLLPARAAALAPAGRLIITTRPLLCRLLLLHLRLLRLLLVHPHLLQHLRLLQPQQPRRP